MSLEDKRRTSSRETKLTISEQKIIDALRAGGRVRGHRWHPVGKFEDADGKFLFSVKCEVIDRLHEKGLIEYTRSPSIKLTEFSQLER